MFYLIYKSMTLLKKLKNENYFNNSEIIFFNSFLSSLSKYLLYLLSILSNLLIFWNI